ncbi:hypothetical protein DUNSADRAFT_7912 [Dunaliella salina]|uniref:Uncharacterized protein n=1 Tax=Dunaliella salina TaxID=3046 RepID=A0ABQ7FT12_DUNSA|nr:hypothetical protein DUNSADRAFT_7912 [Dunaliella salina]|eukprot:KAF5825635.1 hypothetical protein DUNSADRAFT_7912 [Dunaliella salina]
MHKCASRSHPQHVCTFVHINYRLCGASSSTDTCRPGVPFSYAAGDYAKSDNSFLLFNYNSWGVSVMEDEGVYGDHLSGVSATDGNWHHVAVTWDSRTGKYVHHYD